MKYMLDTNICIYSMKNKPAIVSQKVNAHLESGDDLCISSITLAELEHGYQKSVRKEKNLDSLIRLLVCVTVLPFDAAAAVEYGKICAYLESQGKVIGTMDMLIAAHALSENLTIVTNNVREFERVPSLQIENWSE